MTLIRKGMHISTIFINLLLLVIFLSFLSRKIEAQQPSYQYLNHSCPDTTTFPVYATYRANRDSVLSWLSSNASSRDGFYNTTAGSSPDIVYGLFLCRGDVSASVCQECVSFAADDLSRLCPVQKTALLWYDVCLIRFSNQNMFSVLADEPAVPFFTSRNATVEHRFHQLVTVVMNDAANQVANEPRGAKKFATRVANYSRFQTLYALVQCTPDLSGTDCKRCLQGAIANLSDCCSGKSGARILKPSCNVRHQTFLFYDPTIGEDKQNKSNWITVVVASLSATIGLAVVSVFGFFIRRRINSHEDRDNDQEFQLQRSRETLSGENMGNSEEFPSIQLDILHVATNHFSNENKLGEGGFGPVYKGILADGKQIAVKRLSTTSSQGLVEFKNEVVLIARLQHKNLVRLIGCCLEKKEKLLVYEFMPNGSLDAVLFDSILNEPLDWLKRFSIIKGIARGIMYLHEDSRLRVIHRDLKASNVLLDHNMNPKISDFGMARIFGEDKNEAKTRRVVGTYGYMAPEYAMRGLFSIKSDVFSFGVIFLEIISGKKNNSFHDPEGGESLLTFAWNLWSKGEGMELIDPVLVPSCVASEVLKCIHIGLLCVQRDPADRPTMSSVIFMLASDCTTTLPHPTEPSFFVVEPSEPISKVGVFSVNDLTISNFFAR